MLLVGRERHRISRIDEQSKSWFYLLKKYYNWAYNPGSDDNYIYGFPLYLIPSGRVYYDNSKLDRIGIQGWYWSRVNHTEDKAYYMHYYIGDTNPNSVVIKSTGNTVRCVNR